MRTINPHLNSHINDGIVKLARRAPFAKAINFAAIVVGVKALRYHFAMSGISFLRRGGDSGDWRSHFEKQLKRLEDLPAGQDSWSPHRPSRELLEAATRIADDASRHGAYVALVTATSEGGIQLKWQNAINEFSILLYPNQTVEYFYQTADRTRRESGDLNNIQEAGEFVSSHFVRD